MELDCVESLSLSFPEYLTFTFSVVLVGVDKWFTCSVKRVVTVINMNIFFTFLRSMMTFKHLSCHLYYLAALGVEAYICQTGSGICMINCESR